MKYKHLFFDLDHTLWDFDRNSAESIAEIYETHRLRDRGVVSADVFSEAFIRINRKLWADYDRDLIAHEYIREQRFPLVLNALGVTDTAGCAELNTDYLRLLPQKAHLKESAELPDAPGAEPGQWWTRLNDPLLTSLIDRALEIGRAHV